MNAEKYSERGDKCFNENNFDGAIADFTEVIKLEPDNPFAYSKRGMSYIQKKDLDLAIADFTMAIQLEPNKFGDFYVDRGCAYNIKGDKALAIADLEMAVKIDPQNKDYREILGELKECSSKPARKKPESVFGWIVFIFVEIILFIVPAFVDNIKYFKYPANRKEWWGTIGRIIVLMTLFGMVLKDNGAIPAFLIGLIPITLASIRRMADIGKPWWWILVPFANFVMCGFFKGK
jgi:tetratricopeptide (TPR) repeat protein